MWQISLDTYDSAWDISEQIVAERMVWNKQTGAWEFVNGIHRIFSGETNPQETAFQMYKSPLDIKPEQMSLGRVDEDEMSLRDLVKRIRFHKRTGIASYSAQTQFQAKLAAPFATLVMCLLGMPFAISTRRKSKIINIIMSMVIALTFWGVITVCTAVGQNGYIPPFLAGWGPVLLFGGVVFFEFKWMKL